MGHRPDYVGIAFQNSCKVNNYGGLIRAAHNFDANLIMFINRRYKKQCSDTLHSGKYIPIFEFKNTIDFLEHRPLATQLIAVEIVNTAVSILDFIHPAQAIYVFGPEDGNLTTEILNAAQSIIKIPSHHCLNLACAVSVTLYDRLIKKYVIR